VLARAALWLLGADRYGERFWQRLREDIANAPVAMREYPRPEPASATADAPAWLAGAAWRLVALIIFLGPIPQWRKKGVAINTKNWHTLALVKR
jgi:hypothetical protein